MVKLYNIIISFSIFTLQALAVVKSFSETCRAAIDDINTVDEDVSILDCISTDEKVEELELSGGYYVNVTQSLIDKLSTYDESLKQLTFIRFESFSEDLNLESLHLSQITFNALSNGRKNRYRGYTIPGSIIKTIKNVDTIALYGYHITQEIISNFSGLKNVKTIIIQSANIDGNLDFSGMSKNKNLVSLELGTYSTEPPLEEFPESICQLKKLKHLDISSNSISSIPSCIGNLKYLQTLILESINVKTLPKEITKLTALKELNIRNSGLTAIPTNIGNLNKLQKLDLGYNKIKKIPSSFCDLTKLKILDLGENENLPKIPSCFDDLSKLQQLTLSSNNITSIPYSILELKKLEILDMSGNMIKKIPSDITNLTKLKELNLRDNVITKIPNAIGKLSNLEKLNLSYNKITNLPQSLGKLTKLVYLDLSDNQITGTIPEGLNNAKNLDSFSINNNVNIKGRTLTLPLFYCQYTSDNVITNEICLDPDTKCKDPHKDIQPC